MNNFFKDIGTQVKKIAKNTLIAGFIALFVAIIWLLIALLNGEVGMFIAAASTTLFANAVSSIGWKNLILVWTGIAVLGIMVSLPRKLVKKA